jgi:ferredoxin
VEILWRAGAVAMAIGGRVHIEVNPILCEANARCVSVAPDVFTLDDDETLHISLPVEPVEPVDRVRIERAVAACPLNALSIQKPHPSAEPRRPATGP